MNRLRPLLALTLAVACAAAVGLSAPGVFDMPERQPRHIQLLALMSEAHQAQNYPVMEAACRQGLELATADMLWTYNLACALALQGKTQEALDALDSAIRLGFSDAAHLGQDPDLASLRDNEGFKQRLALLATQARDAAPAARPAMAPDQTLTVTQTSTNTEWNFQLGLFQSFVSPATNALPDAYCGPETNALRTWLRAGAASGCAGVIYANRDNNTQPIDTARFPGLMRLAYSKEMSDHRLQLGMPNTLFAYETGDALVPVVGHSSMGYLNSPYWRSQPRALSGDPRQLALQAVFLLGNQIFFYPAFGDYEPGASDLFPANMPYCFAVAGSNNAERPFVEAALAALAALRPETRAELVRTGLLMPTLEVLFRASQRTVKTRQDYLTGLAHPPAFLAENLDAHRLVEMAHSLTTNDLPPLVLIDVARETLALPDRDFFDGIRTERLFDSPLAVGRVFRGAARTRTLEVLARTKRPVARLHWVVLQGDPDKVAFLPCPTNSSLMTLTVAHHEPFTVPLGNGRSIRSSRADIGVIAETSTGFSLPSVISVYFLGNEKRVYAEDGRTVSMDYTRRDGGYTDPLLSYARNWKDVYHYDAQARVTGWTRIRGLDEERFTACGHKVVATDALGRAARAHVVRYLPRRIKTDDGESLPDLAEVDDNREVIYRYSGDDDRVGAPDLATVRQETEAPASAP